MAVKQLVNIPTNNEKLAKWVEERAELCKPEGVYWCDGTQAEYDRLMGMMVDSGLGTKLNPAKRPDSVLFRSDPSDVVWVEKNTYIASKTQEDAGPTKTGSTLVERPIHPSCLKNLLTSSAL